MELINQHTKRIMEGCKERARKAGLTFQDETLEYIVTNRNLLELTPKFMIPTLYDYWVHEVEVLKEKGRYELYPANPYETVINTRPPISFYNDNNPDWLNVMIFYHVLAHIDFFQNNLYFRHTWEGDFTGEALADKRLIAKFRSEKGRWVDYILEFTRGIDNLVGYYEELSRLNRAGEAHFSKRLDFYFDVFLQSLKPVPVHEYIREIERYNTCVRETGDQGEQAFFTEVTLKNPEFEALFNKSLEADPNHRKDLIEFILEQSEFLGKEENAWMKEVVQIVRKTSLFLQPQIRTKIMNEGWASYWHEKLFMSDDRIRGHEVDFARINAGVTAMPRVGLNPYALGMRLFYYIEEMVDKGKYSIEFRKILDAAEREHYDAGTGEGENFLSRLREDYCDFTFINTFVDQDFVDRYKLFVAGKRLNRQKGVWEYFVKSRKAEDYRRMLLDSLYHPPHIEINQKQEDDNSLYLVHRFEGKPLVKDFIANTLIGIEYLWGGAVKLETSELEETGAPTEVDLVDPWGMIVEEDTEADLEWRRVVYTMKNRKLSRKVL